MTTYTCSKKLHLAYFSCVATGRPWELRCLQAGADTNNDGCIDLDEFQHMIENPQVRRVLREADVDATTLINFADVIFEARERADC